MEQMSLFDDNRVMYDPLASRLRPSGLEEFVGQKNLVGEGKVLRRLIDQDMVSSMIFWGPPGVGKTTLARIIARSTKAEFIDFSAVTSGIREIKEVMNQAESARHMGKKTIVFVDEIHRFNKAQQDAFLPFVEKEVLSSSEQLRKIHPLKLMPLFFPAARFLCCRLFPWKRSCSCCIMP